MYSAKMRRFLFKIWLMLHFSAPLLQDAEKAEIRQYAYNFSRSDAETEKFP